MKRVFVPHTQQRFDAAPLLEIADDLVYVCSTPMFDDMTGPKDIWRFEGRIASVMSTFDAENDCIAYYGDAMIFALMVAYLCSYVLEEKDKLKVARFSVKTNSYIVRELELENFEKEFNENLSH